MAKQIIRKLRLENTFRLYWVNDSPSTTSSVIADSAINLDFNPLIKVVQERHGLTKHYCLVHWQAKPKGLRRWGVYNAINKEYLAGDGIISDLPSLSIQINEIKNKTLPTAVVFYPNSIAFLDAVTNLISIKKA